MSPSTDSWKWFARAGYAARGVIYLIVGGLAFLSAIGSGGSTTDTKGAIGKLLEQPFGVVLLLILTVGLLGYSGWRATQAIMDVDDHGRGAKGIAVRGGLAVSAVTHIGLAIYAGSLALGIGSGGSSGGTESRTGALMQQPFGQILVGLVGLAIVGAGIAHLIKAGKAGFKKYLEARPDQMRWISPISRFGLAARGVVFGLIGGFVLVAAWQADPSEAKGLSGALDTLMRQSYGPILMGIVAAGLVAFGTYSLIEARFRRIPEPD